MNHLSPAGRRLADLLFPDEGHRCLRVIAGGKPYSQFFPDNDTFEARVSKIPAVPDLGVYWALATFASPIHAKLDNALGCYTLAVDIDVHGKADEHPSIDAARAALDEAVAALWLPTPWVIVTGRGIHAYWPVSARLSPAEFKDYNTRLVTALRTHGVKTDLNALSTAVALLRVPGCRHGTVDATVTAITEGGVSDINDILPLLPVGQTPVRDMMFTAVPVHPGWVGTDCFPIKGGNDFPESSAALVIERCAQVRSAPFGSSDHWVEGMRVLCATTEGPEFARAESAKDPRYDERADIRINSLNDGAAVQCSTFNIKNPGGCAGCPHAGKVKTPLELGRATFKIAPAPAPLPAPVADTPVRLYRCPPSQVYTTEEVILGKYRFTSEGYIEYFQPPSKEEAKLAEDMGQEIHPTWLRVAPFTVRFAGAQRDLTTGVMVAEFQCAHPNRKGVDATTNVQVPWKHFNLTARDKGAIVTCFADVGCSLSSVAPAYAKFADAIIETTNYLQDYMVSRMSFKRYGLHEMGPVGERRFVTCTSQYSSSAHDVEGQPATPSLFIGRKALPASGTVEGWKTTSAVFDRRKQYGLMYALLQGATPVALAVLEPEQSPNMLVCIHSHDTGTGKTTAANAASTLWAPRKLYGITSNATANFRMADIAKHNCMPTILDEGIDLINPTNTKSSLHDFIMLLESGQGRGRLTKDASQRDVDQFRTIMVTNTNGDPRMALAKTGSRNANFAENSRMIAIRVDKNFDSASGEYAEDQRALTTAQRTNYGVVGDRIVEHVLGDPDAFVARYHKWRSKLEAQELFRADPSKHRFWVGNFATTLAMADLMAEYGLLTISMPAFYAYVVDELWAHQLYETRQSTENTTSATSLDDALYEMREGIMHYRTENGKRHLDSNGKTISPVNASGTYDPETNIWYIRVSAMSSALRKCGLPGTPDYHTWARGSPGGSKLIQQPRGGYKIRKRFGDRNTHAVEVYEIHGPPPTDEPNEHVPNSPHLGGHQI
jgi:hypothetical protein